MAHIWQQQTQILSKNFAGDGLDAGLGAVFGCVATCGASSRAFALLLEKRERLSILWWLFFQRFCYRQLMYWVMIRSVTTAARGVLIGWGKLERKATAEAQS